jgi:predicted Zn-dependent peptidase
VTLPLTTAETLHAHLETLLESGDGDPELERAHRTLAWRLLAARRDAGSAGLTASLVTFAREARTLEEYEAARDDLLGPLLDRLESPENRDP